MKKDYILYIISLLIFGSNGLIVAHIDCPTPLLITIRAGLGAITIFTLFLIQRKKFTFTKFPKELALILVSGIATGFSWMCLYKAYEFAGVGLGTLLYYVGPVIVIAISPILFKEQFTTPKVIGFVTVLIGVVSISLTSLSGTLNAKGLMYGILSAIGYSVMVIASKNVKNINGIECAGFQLVGAFIAALVVSVLTTGVGASVPTASFLPLLLLGVVNTGIGCLLYYSTLIKLPVHSVSILGYLEPLSAVLFAALFLGEKMVPVQIIGALLIIGGALVSQLVIPEAKPLSRKALT